MVARQVSVDLLFRCVGGVVDVVNHFATLQSYPSLKLALALGELDYACAVTLGDVVVCGASTGQTTVAEQYASPIHRVVIYVVVTYECSHHVTCCQHRSTQTRINLSRAGSLLACSEHKVVLVCYSLVVFGDWNVEECQ